MILHIKHIKKRIFFLVFFISTVMFGIVGIFTEAYANTTSHSVTDISLSASKTTVSVDESFSVSLSIKMGTNSNQLRLENISIPGIEEFLVVGSSEQTQFKSIQGVSAVLYEKNLQLVAKKKGVFNLGPVVFSSSTSTQSNVVTVTVVDKSRKTDVIVNKVDNSDVYDTRDIKISSQAIYKSVLWMIILGLFGYILYLTYYTDTNKSKKTEQKQVEKFEGEIVEQIKKDDNQYHGDDIHEAVLNISQETYKLTGRDFYENILDAVFDYVKQLIGKGGNDFSQDVEKLQETIQKSNLSDVQKSTLKSIVLLCHAGKFAPEDRSRRDELKKLISMFT